MSIKVNKKTSRAFAWIGIIFLVGLYISTLVFALMKSPNSLVMFKASIVATIFIPCMIYGYQIVYRYLKSKNDDSKS